MQWLQDNAVTPVETLLNALTTDRHLMRTAMSPDLDQKLQTDQLVPLLEAYLYRVDGVMNEMDLQKVHRIYNKDQLQFEVASEMFDIFSRALGETFTRKGSARRIEAVLSIGCAEILGHDEDEKVNSIVRTVRLGRMRSQLE